MKTYPQRADVLQGYIVGGLPPVEAIKKLNSDPVGNPRHRNAEGLAQTFEALISDYIKTGLLPETAVRAAASAAPELQRDYYARLAAGWHPKALDLVMKGHSV